MLPLNQLKRTGQLSPVELRAEDGHVEMIFPQVTKWVKLSPEQAEAIGHKLLEFSRIAAGRVIIPGVAAN